MRSMQLVPALAAGILLFAACGGGSDGESGSEANATVPPATEVAAPTPDAAPADQDGAADAVVVPAALQFSAPLVGGGDLDASALAGKPTVFWFWAPT